MQRLFDSFPGGGAGLALVILRLAVGASLLAPLVSGARLCPGSAVELLVTLSGMAAALLVIGYWYTHRGNGRNRFICLQLYGFARPARSMRS